MKERLTTLALALGALLLFYALFFPKPAADRDVLDLPVSTETRAHGYQALWRWLEAEKIPLKALHRPYSDLASLPGRGNVLIVSVPPRVAPRRDELEALSGWVSRGNTLLVLAALDDTPPWSLGADPGFLKSLARMTQVDFHAIPEHADAGGVARSSGRRALQALEQAMQPQRFTLRSRGPLPLFEGVRSVVARSEFPASRWEGAAADQSAVLEVAERATQAGAPAAEPVAWLKRAGEGQILVIGFASIFDNALLGEQDNARLFANILAWSRSPRASVIFDDDHQGIVEYYDAKAFFHDPRLHRTLLWIVLLWLLFVLGWQRLRPAAAEWNRVDVTYSIAVTGEFFASVLAPTAAAARLFDNFFAKIGRASGPRAASPVWKLLAADARTRGADLVRLEHLHARVQAGERVDLIELQNLTSRVLGALE